VCLNGDVLFEPRLLRRVLDAGYEGSLAVEAKRCGEEEVKVACKKEDRIVRIGKRLPSAGACGEFIGVSRLRGKFLDHFLRALGEAAANDANAYFEAAIDHILDRVECHAVDVTDLPSIEIDFLQDYERACGEVIDRFSKRFMNVVSQANELAQVG
jgi:choline kinase